MHTHTAIYALTPQGAALGHSLAAALHAQLYVAESTARTLPPADLTKTRPPRRSFARLQTLLEESFSAYRQHIFISAAGIAVRCIAAHINHKTSDPAVIVLDQKGRFVISLLSGHLGGGNALACQVAALTGGQAVITTATDTENLPSLDMLAHTRGLRIHNYPAVACVNAALLAGDTVRLIDPGNHLRIAGSAWEALFFADNTPPVQFPLRSDHTLAGAAATGTASSAHASLPSEFRTPVVEVTSRQRDGQRHHLIVHPPVLHVGIGCRRNTPAERISAAITTQFARLDLSIDALADISSVSIKHDEHGLIDAAAHLGCPLRFFPPEQLATVNVTRPSPKVRQLLGIDSVSEAAALLAAGGGARLLLPKHVYDGMTIAIAESQGKPE